MKTARLRIISCRLKGVIHGSKEPAVSVRIRKIIGHVEVAYPYVNTSSAIKPDESKDIMAGVERL
jgi:hypothetical protein